MSGSKQPQTEVGLIGPELIGLPAALSTGDFAQEPCSEAGCRLLLRLRGTPVAAFP
jgi:hypothetical protein